MLSVNLSENINITKPGDQKFSSNSDESKNIQCVFFAHFGLFDYSDDRMTPKESCLVIIV